MRIAIDVRTVRNRRAGIGIYTQHLVGALAEIRQDEDFILLGASDTAWGLLPSGSGFNHRSLTGATLRWHLQAASIARQVDLYHSPSSLFVPAMVPDRAVLTIHDMVPFLMPEVSNAKTWWTHRAFQSTVGRVKALIAVSQNTATDLLKVMPGLSTPISTIYEAPRPAFRPLGLMPKPYPFDYYLAVGTLEPRKNLPMLLRAYRKATEAVPDLPKLVIAGELGWKNDEFETLLADPWLRERVQLAGYISDEDLLRHIQGAIALVYPSRYEGFGLPVVEAMACGTPVITSACSSLPEVGGNAVLYVDPGDEAALCNQLLKIREPEVRAELSRLGIAQAARFSWEETARQTLALYHETRERAQSETKAKIS